MTVGRPRIFDETQLGRSDSALMDIFVLGTAAGYSAREMGGLLAWLRAHDEVSRVTAAKYRRILAEVYGDTKPPRRRRNGTGARVLVAVAGAAMALQEAGHHAAASGAPRGATAALLVLAPIMHEEVNLDVPGASACVCGQVLRPSNDNEAVRVRTGCVFAGAPGAHSMAAAA